MALWTPAEISAQIIQQIDPDDESKRTIATGFAALNNVIGGTLNYTQGSTIVQPLLVAAELNGLDIVRFTGSKMMVSPRVLTDDNFSAFCIIKAGVQNNKDILTQNDGETSVGRMQLLATSNVSPYNTVKVFFNNGATQQLYSTTVAYDSTWNLIYSESDGAGRTTTRVDAGAEEGTLTGQVWTPLNTSMRLGGVGVTPNLTADIAYILITTKLSEADRQYVEGWMMWRFGLQNNLPADHPYKSAAPTISDITTVTLSLDQPCSLLNQLVTLSLDQPVDLRKLLTLSLDQSCGMELAMTLIQRCRAMPSVTLSLNQWVRSLRRVTLSLDQHVGVCPLVRLSLDQLVRMPGRVTLSLDQAVVIAGQMLTLSLDQHVRMDRNGRVTLSLAQPCAIADGTAVRQQISLSITVGGRIVDPDFVSIKADDSDGFMSATIRFPDYQQYLLCRVGEEVVITELLDDLPAEITVLQVKSLANPEESGSADHILTAVSPTAALDEEPLTDDLGPGVAAVLMTTLVAGYDFTLDWQGVAGWPFLAGELMAEDETVYAVLVRLAAASGAFVQSLPDGETIRLRPEYAVNVGAWSTAVCDLEINDQDHIFSIDEQPDERDGFNAFLVSGQSTAAGNHRLDDIALTATTKEVRFYHWPWDSVATIILGHTGGDWVSIDYLGVFEETIEDEEVVITAGIGQLQLPCYSLISYSYKQDSIGVLKCEEDGSVTTAQIGDALLEVTYKTKFRKWLLTDPRAEHLQIYIEEVI